MTPAPGCSVESVTGPGPGHGDEEGVEAAGGGDLEVSADAGHAVQLGVVPAPQRRQLPKQLLLQVSDKKTPERFDSIYALCSFMWMEPGLSEKEVT